MFTFLKSFFTRAPSTFTGVIEDTRSPIEKARDFKTSEIASAAAPVFAPKLPTEWRKFEVRSQNGSGSCVAQSFAHALGIFSQEKTGEFVSLSASFMYKRRFNRPEAGMNAMDAWRVAREEGLTLESLMPSQNMTDAEMDNVKEQIHDRETAKAFRVKNYVTLDPALSFDEVAAVAEKGTPVIVWFKFNYPEWTDIPEAKDTITKLAHSTTAVDAVTYNNKQYLVISDSWGKFGQFNGQRLISREFYEKRNFYAAYPKNFVYETSAPIKYQWNTDMVAGQSSEDIKQLQLALQSIGHFPADTEPTGLYGGITSDAVYKFQKAEKIPNIDTLKGTRTGPATRAALNRTFA